MIETPVDEVRAQVSAINHAWLGGRLDDLRTLFDADVVFVTPDFSQRLVGVEPCIRSFRDFLENATVHGFTAGPVDVDIVGPTAIGVYVYEIDYSHQGRRWRATGRDLLVFSRRDGDWRLAWRWAPVPPRKRK